MSDGADEDRFCGLCADTLAARLSRPDATPAAVGQVARLLGADAPRVQATVRAALLRYLDRFRGEERLVEGVLQGILAENADVPEVVTFVAIARKAHEMIMAEAYRKTLRSLTCSYLSDGTVARCPACKSTDVYSPGGVYEFTQMVCRACGHDTYVDDYQREAWYPEEPAKP